MQTTLPFDVEGYLNRVGARTPGASIPSLHPMGLPVGPAGISVIMGSRFREGMNEVDRRVFFAVLLLPMVLVTVSCAVWRLTQGTPSFTFAVMGDSQGNSKMLRLIAEEISARGPEFVIHLGDCVPTARASLFDKFLEDIGELSMPVHLTPGNHDIKGSSTLFYSYFGEGNYYFDWRGYRFISVDTSDQRIGDEELAWLREVLGTSHEMQVIVFTHVPPFDPLSGGDHGLLDDTGRMFMDTMEEFGVRAVLAGHMHMFNHSRRNGVEYFVSGGAGGGLYAPPENGGFHHFLLFEARDKDLRFTVVKVEMELAAERVVVAGRLGNITLDHSELAQMDLVEGNSSYQNVLGNWKDLGTYTGVRIADLLELVGGMEEDDVLRIESDDGYYQDFCYSNVYPNASWYSIQGDMVLAFAYDQTSIPSWEDGPRTTFLPEDGGYSNEDCLLTSCPGQGCQEYPSGGSRWVRKVARITILDR